MPFDALHPPQPSAAAMRRLGTPGIRAWRAKPYAPSPSLGAYLGECCA